MKRTTLSALALSGVFAVATPVYAGMGHTVSQPLQLEQGVSATHTLEQGFPTKFQLQVDEAMRLHVSSEHFPGHSSRFNHIRAELRNAQGQPVAVAEDRHGHFHLSQQLQPGSYVLEVSGKTHPARRNLGENTYELHVKFER